jgi:hypothetical protein
MSVAVIATFATLNIRSLRSMALSSVVFAVIILLPCAVMTVLGIAAWRENPFVPVLRPNQSAAASLGLGLTVAIWFYSGYESMSTMAGEVAEPQRVIPRALLITLPAVVVIYFLPTMAGERTARQAVHFSLRAQRVHGADYVVNDVCSLCNRDRLGPLDAYFCHPVRHLLQGSQGFRDISELQLRV